MRLHLWHLRCLEQNSMIVTFLGTKGGTGTTTLAVNCASELRRLSHRPTLIVEVKQGPGDVAVLLGLRPRYSLVDLIDQRAWTDRTLAARFVTEHSSGLHVLAASDAFGRPSSRDAESVEHALRAYAAVYDHVVVDVGSTVNACAATALTNSEVVMLVANPDLPCLRNLQRYGDVLRLKGVAPETVRIVLNRTSDADMLPAGQIERTLSRRLDYRLASDYRTVATAMNAAVPISSLRPTELHEQLTTMARTLCGPRLMASV
jgi:pilus assembly protein CpaE